MFKEVFNPLLLNDDTNKFIDEWDNKYGTKFIQLFNYDKNFKYDTSKIYQVYIFASIEVIYHKQLYSLKFYKEWLKVKSINEYSKTEYITKHKNIVYPLMDNKWYVDCDLIY